MVLLRNCFLMLTVTIVIVVACLPFQAQAIPTLPALCFGQLTVNGQPAPVNTTVEAKINDLGVGALVTTEPGWYGGPGLSSKLAVSGSGHTGKYVKFYVSGSYSGQSYSNIYAGEYLYWGSGEVLQIDIAINLDGTGSIVVPEPGPGPAPAPPENGEQEQGEYAPGDVNGDGEINVQDVALALQGALGLKELSIAQKSAADVNADGVINVLDVTLISQYVLDMIDSFN